MKEANDTMEAAEFLQRRAVKRFETRNKETMELMDSIGQQELEILNSFEKFCSIIEKIQGRPEFKRYNKAKIKLPEYEKEKLIEVSVGTSVLLGVLGVVIFGEGGGGIILGKMGEKLSEQADEAFSQAMRIEREVKRIVAYLDELSEVAEQFKASLTVVEEQYQKCLDALDNTVNVSDKMHWSEFTNKEKQVTENAVLLVGLLYKMCQINLVIQNEEDEGINAVNRELIETTINDAETVLEDIRKGGRNSG